MSHSRDFTGYVLAIGAATLWGISGAFAQFLIEHRGFNAEWLVTVRMLTAGAFFLGFCRARRLPGLWEIWREPASAVRLALFALFGMLAVQYTYFAAIQASNAATATVLQYLGPGMIAGYYTLRERRLPSSTELLALVLATGGTVLLVTHGKGEGLALSPAAVTLGLLSAVALAFNSIQPVWLLDRFPAAVVVGWGMLLGGLAAAPFTAPWRVVGTWDGDAISSLLFIAVFGTVCPFYAYLSAIRRLGARTASLLSCAEPLSATLVAVLWLEVRFTAYDWAGSAGIVGAIALLAARGRDRA